MSLAIVEWARGLLPRKSGGGGRGRVVEDISIWQQFQRIGGSLTPVQVSEIVRRADTGYLDQLIDLANDSRQKDCHLQSVLGTAEETVAGLDWTLYLPEDALARDRRAAGWIEEHLRSMPAFHRLLQHHAGSFYLSHAVSEIEWTTTAATRQAPRDLHTLDARRFGYNLEGVFVWRDTDTPPDGIDFVKKYPDKFVVSRPRVTGDVPTREGLMRVLVWAALFRNWSITDWLRLGEIAWKPWRVGSFTKSTVGKEDVRDLQAALERMSSSGVAMLPAGAQLKVEWPAGAGRVNSHADLYGAMASEMSKATLGQTETTESSTSSGYAQSKTHNEVRKDLRNARARTLALDITSMLVRPMTQRNFSNATTVAEFRFITRDPVDLAAFGAGVKTLKDAGLSIPQVWVRDQAGIPEPKDGEDLLGEGEEDIPIDPATGLPTVPPEDGPAGKNPPAAKPSKKETPDDGSSS